MPVERIAGADIPGLEPNVVGVAALLSPRTGIVDYPGICAALVEALRARGVQIEFGVALTSGEERSDGVVLRAADCEVQARRVVNCAGLAAARIARWFGAAQDVQIVPFRGQYYRLSDRFSNYTQRLVYPVPDPRYPFLGVHLTMMICGFTTVGPNATLSLGRETYAGNTPRFGDMAEMMRFPGFWRMAAKNGALRSNPLARRPIVAQRSKRKPSTCISSTQ